MFDLFLRFAAVYTRYDEQVSDHVDEEGARENYIVKETTTSSFDARLKERVEPPQHESLVDPLVLLLLVILLHCSLEVVVEKAV